MTAAGAATESDLSAPVLTGADRAAPLSPGTRVEVRSSFDRRWSGGFEVVEASGDGYRLLRLSDHTQLPGTFKRDDIRRERRRSGHWWY